MFLPFPPFYWPTDIAPDFLKNLMTRAQTLAGGTVLSVGGVAGLALIPPKIENKNLKLFTQASFIIMSGYGIVQVAKAVSPTPPKPPPKPPEPDEEYSMYVSHPTGSDRVYCFREFNFGTVVGNPVSERRQVYIGMTLHKIGEDYYDYTAQPVVLEPRASREVIWKGSIGCWGPENWEIRFSTWDVSPVGDCLEAGTCHRLGDTGWHPFTTAGLI